MHSARMWMPVAHQSFLSVETYSGHRGRLDPGPAIEGPCEAGSDAPLSSTATELFLFPLRSFLYFILLFYTFYDSFRSEVVNCIFLCSDKIRKTELKVIFEGVWR